jgi:hypothetical protein
VYETPKENQMKNLKIAYTTGPSVVVTSTGSAAKKKYTSCSRGICFIKKGHR